jgi:hypothetical protein
MTKTCTIGPNAVSGERCGKPAVSTFIGSNGVEYAECAEHDVSAIVGKSFDAVAIVGTVVEIVHVGVAKLGEVVGVTATKLRVKVPTYGGRTHKVVTVARSEARVV